MILQNVILKRAGKTRKLQDQFHHIEPEQLTKSFNPELDYYLRSELDFKEFNNPEEIFNLDSSKVIGKLINLHQNKYGDLVTDIDFNVQFSSKLSEEDVKNIIADHITGLGSVKLEHDLNDKNLIRETEFRLAYAVLDTVSVKTNKMFMAA